MTAIQEQEIKREMIKYLDKMDGQDVLILLNVAKRFMSIEDLEDVLEEEADLEAIEEAEKEFALGREFIMEI